MAIKKLLNLSERLNSLTTYIQIYYTTSYDVCESYLALVKQLTAPSPYGLALPL